MNSQTISTNGKVDGAPLPPRAGRSLRARRTAESRPGGGRQRGGRPGRRAPTAWQRARLFLAAALAVVVADLGTKALASASLQRYRPVEVVGEWVRLTLGYNEGVAFGLFATDAPGVVIATGLVVAALAVWAVLALRDPATPRRAALGLGLVLGGGLANVLDRIGDGRVTDFLDVGLGAHRWPTFNLADVGIVVGVALLVLGSFGASPGRKEGPQQPSPTGPPGS